MPTRISRLYTYSTAIVMLTTACSPLDDNGPVNDGMERENTFAAVDGTNPREIRDRLLEKDLPCDGDTIEDYKTNSAIRCDEELIINSYKSNSAFEAAVKYHQSQETAIAGEDTWLLISKNKARMKQYAATLNLHMH